MQLCICLFILLNLVFEDNSFFFLIAFKLQIESTWCYRRPKRLTNIFLLLIYIAWATGITRTTSILINCCTEWWFLSIKWNNFLLNRCRPTQQCNQRAQIDGFYCLPDDSDYLISSNWIHLQHIKGSEVSRFHKYYHFSVSSLHSSIFLYFKEHFYMQFKCRRSEEL